MNFPTLTVIPLDLITENKHWDIHPFLDPEISLALAESFKQAGILQPPLVHEQKSGSYQLIAGKRRVLAARNICRLSACHCFVAPATIEIERLLNLLIEAQSNSSSLTPMEAAHFFKIGARYLPDEELANRYLLRLAGKNNPSLLKGYRLLLSLENEVQQLVHSSCIPESMAYELVKLESSERLCLVHLFREYQLGGGKQKRLFSLLRDIAQRQGTQISELIQRHEIKEILEHKEMNAPQKMQNLLAFLQQKQTPSLQADEEQFRSDIGRLKLPPRCTARHSPAFETDVIELTIKFDDIDHLRKGWPTLQRALQGE